MKLFVHGELDKLPGRLSYNDPLTGKYSSEAFSDLVLTQPITTNIANL